MNDRDLVESLAEPWLGGRITCPDGPVTVHHMHETHTCLVFLDETRAFKLRKPVDLGFLDYRTVALRQESTNREYTLGSAISPHVYHGVWSLGTEDAPVLDDRMDPTCEPVLVMRRLPAELCAAAVFAVPDTPVTRLDAALEDCCRFHLGAPVDTRFDGWGAIENTVGAWSINFEHLPVDEPTLPLDSSERSSLIAETDDWLTRNTPLLENRIDAGRIREGHGDLRLEHVYLTEPWSVIDPLDFSRSLRFCDVAAEIGFLAMELDEAGRPDAADYLIRRYAESTGDDTLEAVTPFFKRYRAVVRAKIEWIRSTQQEADAAEQHRKRSRELFELALQYSLTP